MLESNKKTDRSPKLLLVAIIGFVVLGALSGALLVGELGRLLGIHNLEALIRDMQEGNYIEYLNVLQVLLLLGSLASFLLPSLFFVYFFYRRRQRKYLLATTTSSWTNYIITAIAIVVFSPFFFSIAQWNQELVNAESSNQAIAEVLVRMQTPLDFALNLILVGLVAAVGEELLFRGILQRLFSQVTQNIHTGILITGSVFSIIHDLNGFFPRLMMGIAFGYLLYWTGSIWVTIFAHAFFNSAQVVMQYFLEEVVTEADTTLPMPWVITSAVLTGIIAYLIWYVNKSSEHKLNPETYLNP